MFFVDITWGIRWCKELHCIHIVRVEHWAVERSWKELDLTYPETVSECYMYWDVFFCCSSPYLVGCFYFGRPERAGQQSFFGAQWPEHLVWCLLTARLLVASDSCRHVAENTFLVDEVFRFIKLHYSHTNLELPVVTFCLSGKEIISPNVLALSRWQYNHIQNQDILHTVIKHMSKYSQDKKNVQPISNLRFYALSGP